MTVFVQLKDNEANARIEYVPWSKQATQIELQPLAIHADLVDKTNKMAAKWTLSHGEYRAQKLAHALDLHL
jgi:hypothetical protein